MKRVKIKNGPAGILYNGEHLAPGKTYTVDDQFAVEIVAANRADFVEEPPSAAEDITDADPKPRGGR